MVRVEIIHARLRFGNNRDRCCKTLEREVDVKSGFLCLGPTIF